MGGVKGVKHRRYADVVLTTIIKDNNVGVWAEAAQSMR